MRRRLSGAVIGAVLAVAAVAPAATADPSWPSGADVYDLNFGTLSFGQDLDLTRTGALLVEGFNHTYSNVVTIGDVAIDAKVTLVEVVGHKDGEIDTFDQYDNSTDISWHTQVNGTSTDTVSVRVRFEFFEGGTTTPVALKNIRLSIADIDGNATTTEEFVRFYRVSPLPAISEYRFSHDPVSSLYLQNVPTKSTLSLTFRSTTRGGPVTDTERNIEVVYDRAHIIELRTGCATGAVTYIGSNGRCGFTVRFGAGMTDVNDATVPVVITRVASGPSDGWFSATVLKLCESGEESPNCTATTLTTGDGTYTVVSGGIRFVPGAGFSGVQTPLTYQADDSERRFSPQFFAGPPPAASAITSAPQGVSVECGPEVLAPGTEVSCVVTGGSEEFVILWVAALTGAPFAGEGVTLDASGSGTFSFVVPSASAGQGLTVELVEWAAPVSLGTVGGPLPTSVPTGGGPVSVSTVLVLALAGGLALRRRSGSGWPALRVS